MFLKTIIFAAFFVTVFSPQTVLASDAYTVNSNLRHNPGVTANQLDDFIRSVYPSSPLVGLGQAWVTAGAKYNIDPVYLMAHAILESGWGFSWISANKFNIYGWGAYDRDPEGMAIPYSSYTAGIDYVAANINAMYLTPGGDYYTPLGPTLRGMNVHYATSKTWADSIAAIMNEFAAQIAGYNYSVPFREYDATYSKVDVPSVMQPGVTQLAILRIGNNGDAAWPVGGDFKLRYQLLDKNGQQVASAFVNMPLAVESGKSALISFPMTAPATVGNYAIRFDMVFADRIVYADAGVEPLKTGLSVLPLSPYYSVAMQFTPLPEIVYAGTMLKPDVFIKNTSSSTWPEAITTFGYQWIDLSNGQPIAINPMAGTATSRVFPGDTVKVASRIRVPERPGQYLFRASCVDGGSVWFSSNGAAACTSIINIAPDIAASYALIGDIGPLLAGTPKTVYVSVTNRSRMTWVANGAVRLSYSFAAPGSHDSYKVRLPLQSDVEPGQTITLPVELSPPLTGGDYKLTFDLLYEGLGWFSDLGSPAFRVPAPVAYDMKVAYDKVETGNVDIGHYTTVYLKVTNTSAMVWPAGGHLKAAYRFGYKPDYEDYFLGGALNKTVKPGESTELTFTIHNTPDTGVFNLGIDLWLDGAGWFSSYGNTTPSLLIVYKS